jgi:8-oxo-dGTP diphosphatase
MTESIANVIYVVRHAKAGSRNAWAYDDRPRPLTPAGVAQAMALADVLAPLVGNGRLISSPFARCVQTLQPLAGAIAAIRSVVIETDERLGESMPFGPVLDLVLGLPARSVLCSHGDVIPDLIAALDRRGVDIVGTPRWEKCSTWVVQRSGSGSAQSVVRAWSWPPPS